VRAIIKQWFFTDSYRKPTAKIEVRLTSDGTIIQPTPSSQRRKAWDEAAMNAITTHACHAAR
jgi:hypothetical protein